MQHFWQYVDFLMRLWLDLLQHYRRFLALEAASSAATSSGAGGGRGNDNKGNNNEQHEAAVLSLLKTMTQVLMQLRTLLQDQLPSLVSSLHQQPPQQAQPLQQQLVDSLSLPARSFLKVTAQQEDNQSVWQVTTQNRVRIRQTAQIKVVNECVAVLTLIHKHAIAKGLPQTSSTATNTNATIVSFLISIATALPSGQEVDALRRRQSYNFQDTSRQECIQNTCQSLAEMVSSMSRSSSGFAQSIGSALEGALFVRVVDTLTVLILPPSSMNDKQNGNNLGAVSEMGGASTASGSFGSNPKTVQQALETLRAWLQACQSLTIQWKQVFPGTFAALFPRLMLVVKSSSGISSKSNSMSFIRSMLRALTLLLENTLMRVEKKNTKKHQQNSRKSQQEQVLARLRHMATATQTELGVEEEEGKLDKAPAKQGQESLTQLDSKFLKHAQSTLPVPLTHLIRQLLPQFTAVQTTCTTTDNEFVGFLKLILTAPCWQEAELSVGSDEVAQDKIQQMLTAAIDSLVMVHTTSQITTSSSPGGNQDNDSSTSAGQQLLAELLGQNQPLRQLQGNRFSALLEEASVSCLGQHSAELHATLVLMAGYASLTQGQKQLQHDLQSLLLHPTTAADTIGVSPSLITTNGSATNVLNQRLWQLDFAHWPHFAPEKMLHQVPKHTATKPSYPPLRYLREEPTHTAATQMVQSLTKNVLGVKGVCVLVDQGVADLYHEARRHHTQQKDSVLLDLYHSSVSSVVWMTRLVESVRCSAFDPDKSAKQTKRIVRSILSLSKAVLPILTSPTLWNLKLVSGGAAKNSSLSFSSAVSFKGQCCLKFVLLDLVMALIKTSCLFLDNNHDDPPPSSAPRELLHLCLYSVLEAIVEPSCRAVQQMAVFTLETLSSCAGFVKVSDMLQFYSASLSNKSLQRLRAIPATPPQRSGRTPLAIAEHTASQQGSQTLNKHSRKEAASPLPELDSIAGVTCLQLSHYCECYKARKLGAAARSGSTQRGDVELSNIKAVVAKLLVQFDHNLQSLGEDSLLQFLWLFQNTEDLLSAWLETIGVVLVPGTVGRTATSSRPSWIRALDRFKKVPPQRLDDEEEATRSMLELPAPLQLVTNEDTAFVSSLLTRAGHLLAHDSLFVQVASCEALRAGLEFLGRVSRSNTSRGHKDETNGARTAILRHSADTWPMIWSRFRFAWSKVSSGRISLSQSLASSPKTPPQHNVHLAGLLSPPHSGAVGELRSSSHHSSSANKHPQDSSQSLVFLERLTSLLAVMVTHAEDFIASRFQDHVCPLFLEMLSFYSSASRCNEKTHSGAGERGGQEQQLIRSVLQCLGHVYKVQRAGESLVLLIPKMASAVLPWITEKSEIDVSKVATETIVDMAQIDHDAVLALVKETIPCNEARPSGGRETDSHLFQDLLERISQSTEQELW